MNMKRFLSKLLLFVVLLGLILAVFISVDLFVFQNQFTQAYTGAILDKMERLHSIQEPKIILVGNSNLSFGIDSAKIEEALGMPVVNLGLHGGLGNAFHEEMAKSGIKEGDIVVLCHIDYSDDALSDPVLAWITLEKHFDLWDIVRTKDYALMLRAYPQYFIKALRNWATNADVPAVNNAYSRTAFNEYGDIAFRPNQDSVRMEFYEGSTPIYEIGETGITRVNAFNAFVQDKGATMLVTFYPIAQGEYSPSEEEYLEFQAELDSHLDCEIISDVRDYFIPYEYFYDTVYHLDDRGVAIRTEQLIEDLINWRNSNEFCKTPSNG